MTEKLPVVFVPGLGCTARLFEAQLAVLGDRPAIVADHTRHADIAAIAEDALGAAPERFALVGLSMGGYVALEIIRRAPERVARLALLDTTAYPDTEEGRARRRTLIAAAERGKLGSIHAATFARYVEPNRVADAALEAVVRDMLFATGAPAFVRQMTAILNRADYEPLLERIACPTLVLVGENDAPTPPDHARRMATAIPGARLAVLPTTGHLSTLENPDGVNAELTPFLG
ncbi:alpha/beta fold hydrolase [Methylopila turkensis]|uniref:Hydrolase n=1 Tax=Methylopila turkensis TaxID=1437816 RepID=A0A9W6JNP3_9HYPH|nr:alpha/beta fold hydrolase [Methylopila turkensis]GLK80986.1 hydrolase [Methylopila turkensis]